MGRTNFCPLSLAASNRRSLVATAVHEILHALGFSSAYFWRWRHPDTLQPRTPREFGFDGPPVTSLVSSCAGFPVYFPGESVASTFAERGVAACPSTADRLPPSGCVTKIVTPLSTQAARWFTGCHTLNGIEIENNVPGQCSSMGSHLEQRVYENNIMAPFLSTTSAHRIGMSAPVLAMMEDSGWYKANWTAQDTYTPNADWAFKRGCKFAAEETCIVDGTVPAHGSGRFCTQASEALCSSDHKWRSVCNIRNFATDLPLHQRYFSNPRRGGVQMFDYCPIVQPLVGGSCTDAAGAAPSSAFGTQQGPSSRCFPSTLASASTHGAATSRAGRCMQVSCEAPDGNASSSEWTARVILYGAGDSSQASITCTEPGEVAAPPGFHGSLTCPDPRELCGGVHERFNPLANATEHDEHQTTGGAAIVPSVSPTVTSTASSPPMGSTARPSTSSTGSPTASASSTPSIDPLTVVPASATSSISAPPTHIPIILSSPSESASPPSPPGLGAPSPSSSASGTGQPSSTATATTSVSSTGQQSVQLSAVNSTGAPSPSATASRSASASPSRAGERGVPAPTARNASHLTGFRIRLTLVMFMEGGFCERNVSIAMLVSAAERSILSLLRVDAHQVAVMVTLPCAASFPYPAMTSTKLRVRMLAGDQTVATVHVGGFVDAFEASEALATLRSGVQTGVLGSSLYSNLFRNSLEQSLRISLMISSEVVFNDAGGVVDFGDASQNTPTATQGSSSHFRAAAFALIGAAVLIMVVACFASRAKLWRRPTYSAHVGGRPAPQLQHKPRLPIHPLH